MTDHTPISGISGAKPRVLTELRVLSEITADHIENALGLANALFEIVVAETDHATDEHRARLTCVRLIEDNLRGAGDSHQRMFEMVREMHKAVS